MTFFFCAPVSVLVFFFIAVLGFSIEFSGFELLPDPLELFELEPLDEVVVRADTVTFA